MKCVYLFAVCLKYLFVRNVNLFVFVCVFGLDWLPLGDSFLPLSDSCEDHVPDATLRPSDSFFLLFFPLLFHLGVQADTEFAPFFYLRI